MLKYQMTQDNNSINSHIEAYLNYYCNLPHAPGFAVLLKGKWGSGKTWFINKYCEQLKNNKRKCLYISLYGMTAFSEIEDVFFKQLHPLLSSKGMAITGKILKGLLKGTLKIDLNNDSRDEGTVSPQVPDINLPDYLNNTDQSILVFDDLERCKIELGHILGYINYFVEHQGLKVVIVANEEELLKEEYNRNYNSSYKVIKEKLIGKTFDVSPKNKYNMVKLEDSFPSLLWWQTFFDKGIVDKDELENKYHLYEDPPNWVKIRDYRYLNDLTDDDFENLLKKIESEYGKRKFRDLGVIKDIFRLFLSFSKAGLYAKSKADIIKDSRDYIDYLKSNHQDAFISSAYIKIEQFIIDKDSYDRGSQEFKDFCNYIEQKRKEVIRDEYMPTAGEKLLDVMQSDVREFNRVISRNRSQNENLLDDVFYKMPIYKIPIFTYIKQNDFVEKILQMNSPDRGIIFYSLKERYSSGFNKEIIEELDWLQSVRDLLLQEANSKKGKLSGYLLKSQIIDYLDEALKNLESKTQSEE